jgi:hypothetical protein
MKSQIPKSSPSITEIGQPSETHSLISYTADELISVAKCINDYYRDWLQKWSLSNPLCESNALPEVRIYETYEFRSDQCWDHHWIKHFNNTDSDQLTSKVFWQINRAFKSTEFGEESVHGALYRLIFSSVKKTHYIDDIDQSTIAWELVEEVWAALTNFFIYDGDIQKYQATPMRADKVMPIEFVRPHSFSGYLFAEFSLSNLKISLAINPRFLAKFKSPKVNMSSYSNEPLMSLETAVVKSEIILNAYLSCSPVTLHELLELEIGDIFCLDYDIDKPFKMVADGNTFVTRAKFVPENGVSAFLLVN